VHVGGGVAHIGFHMGQNRTC